MRPISSRPKPRSADGRGVEEIGAGHAARIARLGSRQIRNETHFIQHVVRIDVGAHAHAHAGAVIAAEIAQGDAAAGEHGRAMRHGRSGFGEAGQIGIGVPGRGGMVVEKNAMTDNGTIR